MKLSDLSILELKALYDIELGRRKNLIKKEMLSRSSAIEEFQPPSTSYLTALRSRLIGLYNTSFNTDLQP